jgi:hypothetical protein
MMGEKPEVAACGEGRRYAMYPLEPTGNSRPEYPYQKWRNGQEPSAGKEVLMLFGIFAGVIGLVVGLAAI